MKKVRFNDIVQVKHIPREPRRGTWVADRVRFMQRDHALEKLLSFSSSNLISISK